MSDRAIPLVDRLLIDRATQGLSEEEQHRLDVALRAQRWRDPDEYERVAALIDVALWASHGEALPDRLKRRLDRLAGAR